MAGLLLMTHATRNEFDNGILSERLPRAVRDFPGKVAHIQANEDTPQIDGEASPPYGGEEIFDINVIDEWQGGISRKNARMFLEFDPIYRAGAQFNECCLNTDSSLVYSADGDLTLRYLDDLTVAYDEQQEDCVLLENYDEREVTDWVDPDERLTLQFESYF